MKKNILAIAVLAISLINLLLSILIVFTLVPSAIKTNNLIGKVASNIDLEIQSIGSEMTNKSSVPFSDLDFYSIDDLTINLKNEDTNSRNSYAQVSMTFSINKNDKDYKKIGSQLETYESFITEIITDEFSEFTASSVMDNKENIKESILAGVRERFNSDCIESVSIGKIVVDSN
jgi:flagellar basal body-associated protein FliL